MRKPRVIFIALLMLCLSMTAMTEISVIAVKHGDAQQLLPAIKAQLGPDSSVNVYQNRIVLDASRQETARVRTLVEKLDAEGRPLLISVKTDSEHAQQQTDNNVRITHKSDNEHAETRITTTTRTIGASGQGDGQQSVRATEGMPAFIDIGQSRVYNSSDQGSPWQHAGSGFYATAWINGNRVSVNIEQKQTAFSSDSRIDAQQLNTRINGRVGQWMSLGTLSGYDRQHQGGNTGAGRYSTMIYLKVEPLF